MDISEFVPILATAIATSTPLVLACLGETITERAGVINLSAEGTILLGAMTSFAIAKTLEGSGTVPSLLAGFAGAALVGAAIALIVAFGTLTLKQSQVAIGFVLALLGTNLSSFLGNSFVRIPGPTVPSFRVPGLESIPFVGSLLFQSDLLVYRELWRDRAGVGLLLSDSCRSDAESDRRTTQRRLCAGDECRQDALCLHADRWSHDGNRRSRFFSRF